MRYSKLFIGIVCMWCIPVVTQAASTQCAAIANQITAVSPYMQQVLARADAGISFAQTAQTAADFERYKQSWVEHIEQTWRNITDTQLQRRRQYEGMRRHTSCVQLDRFLLHCKLEQVRDELHRALRRNSWAAIWRLTDLLTFLHEREEHLLRGIHDPLYRDLTWHRTYFFDDPSGIQYGQEGIREGSCGDGEQNIGEQCDDGNTNNNDGCSNTCENEMCAFSSDYLAVSTEGTGCDVEVLQAGNRQLFPPVQQAYEALMLLREARARLQTDIRALGVVRDQLHRLTGQQAAPTAQEPITDVPHHTINGCQHNTKTCQFNTAAFCRSHMDCIPHGGGRCVHRNLIDVVITPKRQPFSLETDHWGILNTFQDLRRTQGLSRRHRKNLLFQHEKPEEEQTGIRDELGEATKPFTRQLYRTVSGQQGSFEGVMFAESVDPERMTITILRPLRRAIALLSQVAGERIGLRSLVEKTAYFLLRTCMDKPCNLRLQHIVKLAQTDECFPYVNGAFLQDTCQEPRWKKCIDAIRAKEAGWTDPSFNPFEITYPDVVCP